MRLSPSWLVLVALAIGCDRSSSSPAPTATPPATSAALPALPWKAAAIAHGGQGSPPSMVDGCRAAVDAALAALDKSGDPVDAAVAGVMVLEDDWRFNAGTGSVVRIDGHTVQMDAAVMRSDGRFGAVAGVEEVRNPVRVARAVMDTPHLMLAGDGATRFARTLGMPVYDPRTPESLARVQRTQAKLLADDPSLPEAWRNFDWRSHWNFERSIEDAGLAAGPRDPRPVDAGHDTVGVAVRASDGRFGVALSTGGTGITLRGRVGDVPILGAGLYAGKYGAAASTGTGERIVEAGIARKVQDWLAAGATAEEAARRAVDLVGAKDLAIIVIHPASLAAGTGPGGWRGRGGRRGRRSGGGRESRWSRYPSRFVRDKARRSRDQARSTRYPTRSARYQARSTRYQARSTRYPTRSARYQAPSTRYPTRSARYQTPSTRHPTRSARYQAPSTRCPTRSARYQARSTRYPTRSARGQVRPTRYPTRTARGQARPTRDPSCRARGQARSACYPSRSACDPTRWIVHGEGLEPSCLAAAEPKSAAYAISPPVRGSKSS